MHKIFLVSGLVVVLALFSSGCGTVGGNVGNVSTYSFKTPEPDWIRNGEPIEFEGDLWYPLDSTDILLDSEVTPISDYKDVPVYVQTVDVRPYNRIYTKFAKNRFRVFETKARDDKSKKAF